MDEIISQVSDGVRRRLSNEPFDKTFQLNMDVECRVDGEDPITLRESLVNNHKLISREDDISEIVKRRINTMISNIAGRYVSGDYVPKSKVKITKVKVVLI